MKLLICAVAPPITATSPQQPEWQEIPEQPQHQQQQLPQLTVIGQSARIRRVPADGIERNLGGRLFALRRRCRRRCCCRRRSLLLFLMTGDPFELRYAHNYVTQLAPQMIGRIPELFLHDD